MNFRWTVYFVGDWRLEIKKREKAKMQEKMNAMKIGMPDYREPEKAKQLNWRDNLKQVYG